MKKPGESQTNLSEMAGYLSLDAQQKTDKSYVDFKSKYNFTMRADNE